ncbi:hypothetical protein C2S52_008139 [Perilla frutescens var. hirtella]|nr:hypothetical protein C2S52_008139 [Perilla frutescens var. hirtella]
MAYAVLFSLAQSIAQILNHDQYLISLNGKQEIESLRKQVTSLQEFLEKFPKEANSFETRIRNAANEAEDILEHFMYEHIRSHHKSIRSAAVGRPTGKTTNFLYDFRELKMAMEEINSIVKDAADITTGKTPTVDTPTAPNSWSTHTPADGGVTIGLEEDLMKIMDFLCGGSSESQKKRQIISIVGMGGIGKTTLARNAYEDRLVMESFPVRAWVTVSQDYKPQNVFSNLLDSLKDVGTERSGQSNESMQDRVYKILMGRKYLIVLDDIWTSKAWDDVKKIFPDNSNGSRIVITTRLADVASYADSSIPFHQMRFMDSEQSWSLLKQKVFPSRDCPSELETIGKDVASNCGGLPLAIVLVAGILSTVSEARSSWEEVAKKVHSAVDEGEGAFEKIISLSYTHLPHFLRPCFLYMGGFPEDYEIRVSKLIKLWIAEGFIKTRESKSLEEGAEEYLEDLIRRNVALVTTRKSNGKIKSCNVHDLVRDVCKKKALDENYERRMSIAHPDLTRLARAYGSTLRSVVSFQPNESSLGGLRKFRLLRVLDVVDTDAYSLPAPVFELFHLRYLAFGCPMEIPTAISRLQNLRTLIICPSKRFRRYSMDELYLPLEIWTMPLLMHLVSFFDLLPNPEGAASALEKLLTLSVVKKLICTKEMMGMIPNIKKLGITYFGEKYQEDYQLYNLVLLRQLEKLKLVMKAVPLVRLKISPVFPETLKKLTLSGWRFPWSDLQTTVGSLPNLQVLKLRDHACEGDKWETNEGEFPSLEFLLIDASDIEEWITEKDHFPRLKRLKLYRCSSLREIPNDIGEIPTVEVIEVDHANASLVKCVKGIQEEQLEYGNDSLQVRCVHYQGF